MSQSEVQPLDLDRRSPAPQQANITSATADNHFNSSQLPAPNSPEYQPIGELNIFISVQQCHLGHMKSCMLALLNSPCKPSFQGWQLVADDQGFSNSNHQLDTFRLEMKATSATVLRHTSSSAEIRRVIPTVDYKRCQLFVHQTTYKVLLLSSNTDNHTTKTVERQTAYAGLTLKLFLSVP